MQKFVDGILHLLLWPDHNWQPIPALQSLRFSAHESILHFFCLF